MQSVDQLGYLRVFACHPSTCRASPEQAHCAMQVAANDEICQEVAASGGVELALRILEAGAAVRF